MKNDAVAFRARARTIDHLGKGQIADCPTAVSELWKNSYDAYATEVILHTFDGEPQCGLIADNGCGMTIDQLVRTWLVIGTESKSKKQTVPDEDTFGLPRRKTQGEKGIGRLSAAFLAPVMFLVSKKINHAYCAALLDWRLFENSYLSLEDIHVPIAEFESIHEVNEVFSKLLKALEKNLRIHSAQECLSDSEKQIQAAWKRFGAEEIEAAKKLGRPASTTEQRIANFCRKAYFSDRFLNSWLPLLENVKQTHGASHGTALFFFDLERDLALLTNPGTTARDNQETASIKKDLIDTLRAFSDPFVDSSEAFRYEIKTFDADNNERVVLAQGDSFDYGSFLGLEHLVRGHVDATGTFTGTVRAFGKDLGEVTLSPTVEIGLGGTKVGPFALNIGTFEMQQSNSSLSEVEHSMYLQQAQKYSGLMIFRDGLRVLPYGRVDNDFFEMEEKRSLNAGRYYWSKRRIFGQILISQDTNSLLKDKAGREGFIKNQAARELKSLVATILDDLADRFFGARSTERREMLNIVKHERMARKQAQESAKKVSQKAFISELRLHEPLLREATSELGRIFGQSPGASFSREQLDEMEKKVVTLEDLRVKIKTPTKPPVLGENEERYRRYRDAYEAFSLQLTSARAALNSHRAKGAAVQPVAEVNQSIGRNADALNNQLDQYLVQLKLKVGELIEGWHTSIQNDKARFAIRAKDVASSVTRGADLSRVLDSLDGIRGDLADEFSVKYASLVQTVERLIDGINLEFAFSMAEEERAHFEEKAKSMQALAQLGISVEILAHEMEAADATITRGLNSLPKAVKELPAFISAMNAHKSLTHQIRFLSPLKLSGYQVRREITGADIRDHLLEFFGDRFLRQEVALEFGALFLRMKIRDIPSRIFPVFTNLLNNALYWVCLGKTREIKIDLIEGQVVIANSGPPVDEDDISRLFQLFYSRRANGHGVGLYLCRENLAVARHRIRYAQGDDPKLISEGANFIINFNGMEISQ